MAPCDHDNGWDEYRIFVTAQLKEISERLDKLTCRVECQNVELATLRVKAGSWGAIAGAVVAIGGILVGYLSRVLK